MIDQLIGAFGFLIAVFARQQAGQPMERRPQFVCESCGEKWWHEMWWFSRDYCPTCGEIVEAQ